MNQISSTWMLRRSDIFPWNLDDFRAKGDIIKPGKMLPARMQTALILNLEDKGWDSNFAALYEPLPPSVLTFLMDREDCIS